MPHNTAEFWIGLPPFLFLVKGGSRPTYYPQTHTTLVNLARLYSDGPSTADGETVEVRQYKHCQKLHKIMTDKTFRANVHRLQQGRPFTMQRSDTKVWAEIRAKSETWGSDGPGSLKEMQVAAERSMDERYRSPSPARSYIIISSDEEQDDDGTRNQSLHIRRAANIKRAPSHEVEVPATPSPTPARSRNFVTTNARTVRSQSRAVSGTSSILPSRTSALHPSNVTASSIRPPRTIKAEPSNPEPSDTISNPRTVSRKIPTGIPSTSAPIRPLQQSTKCGTSSRKPPIPSNDNGRLMPRRDVQVLLPKTLVGARKRSTAGLGLGQSIPKSEPVSPAIAQNSAASPPRNSFNKHSGLFSPAPAKRRRGRSISSDTTPPPPTRLRMSQYPPPKHSISTKTQARTQTPLSELSALTESSRASVDSADSDYADLPVSALLNRGVRGESLYGILSGRRKEQATRPCTECVKKGKTCFIGRYIKRGRPSKICIFCQSYNLRCSLGVH